MIGASGGIEIEAADVAAGHLELVVGSINAAFCGEQIVVQCRHVPPQADPPVEVHHVFRLGSHVQPSHAGSRGTRARP